MRHAAPMLGQRSADARAGPGDGGDAAAETLMVRPSSVQEATGSRGLSGVSEPENSMKSSSTLLIFSAR